MWLALLICLTIFFVVLIREYLGQVLGWLAGLPEWQGAIFFVGLFIIIGFPMMWGYVSPLL